MAKRRNRAKSRYRLAHPERLILIILLLALLIIAAISCRKQQPSPGEEESSGTSVVEVSPGSQPSAAPMGVVKPVSTTSVEGITEQMMGYMHTMLATNENNSQWSPDSPSTDPLDYVKEDLSQYRYIVCIDPGHGGTDKGQAVGGVVEKDIALRVASHAMAFLQTNNDGYYFFMTRDTDVTLTEAQRATKAMTRQADLVVTIHINGSQEELGGTIGTYYDGNDARRTSESQFLARELMDATADAFHMWTRGERSENSLLLKGEYVAAAVYMGFATYPYDNSQLLDEEAQEAAGNAIGKVILDFVNNVAPKETKGEIAAREAAEEESRKAEEESRKAEEESRKAEEESQGSSSEESEQESSDSDN